MYKNAKIDTESNRVIHRKDFDRLQHVCNLVLTFEVIYPELHIETVWFIKKSCHGDGFQRWHQDLNANGQVVATIVLNIDNIPTEEIVDAIKESSSSSSSQSLSAYETGFESFAEQETRQDNDFSPQSGVSRRSPEKKKESWLLHPLHRRAACLTGLLNEKKKRSVLHPLQLRITSNMRQFTQTR
jgi:hypothetical protein